MARIILTASRLAAITLHCNILLSETRMLIERFEIPDVVHIEPKRIGDHRGYFSEVFRQDWFAENVEDVAFVQENQSLSVAVGTVRGLHFQTAPAAQGKLLRCLSGALLDVAVDIRRGSPTYGKWVGVELTPDNARQLLVPKGFLHGFVTLAPMTEVQYKCSDVYAPDCDGGIRWNDPDIGIDWGVDDPTLSAKDTVAPFLRDFQSPFEWSPS